MQISDYNSSHCSCQVDHWASVSCDGCGSHSILFSQVSIVIIYVNTIGKQWLLKVYLWCTSYSADSESLDSLSGSQRMDYHVKILKAGNLLSNFLYCEHIHHIWWPALQEECQAMFCSYESHPETFSLIKMYARISDGRPGLSYLSSNK